MSVSVLFDGDFDAYFAPTTSSARPLWLMVHVPKTAGSSMGIEIGKMLEPRANINGERGDMSLPYAERLEAGLQRFLAAHELKPFGFVSGHISGDQAERIRQAIPGTRSFGMLREPVARAISGYNYQRTPRHREHEEFRRMYDSIDAFLAKGYVRNRCAFHLVPSRIVASGKWEDCLEYILATYDFIGLQETYQLSFRIVTRLMGSPKRPTRRANVNTAAPEEKVDVTEALAEQIRGLNTIDQPLFEEFRKRFAAIRVGANSYLDELEKVEGFKPVMGRQNARG